MAEVNDGETLTLTDGTVVRLVGAKAPSASLGWRGDQPWPLVAEANRRRRNLPRAPRSSSVSAAPKSIVGHALAQVFALKGGERVWLQGELVAKGLARVYSFPDNHA